MAQSFQNVTLSLTLPISCQICLGKVTNFQKKNNFKYTTEENTHRVVQCARERHVSSLLNYTIYITGLHLYLTQRTALLSCINEDNV